MMKVIQALLAVGLLMPSLQAPRQEVPPDANQGERNKDVVRRFFEKQNGGDAGGSADEWAESAANDGQPIPGDARRFFQRAKEDLHQTFPDWHMEIVDLAAQGDSVVALCRVTGTHRGIGRLPLNGICWWAWSPPANGSTSRTSTGSPSVAGSSSTTVSRATTSGCTSSSAC